MSWRLSGLSLALALSAAPACDEASSEAPGGGGAAGSAASAGTGGAGASGGGSGGTAGTAGPTCVEFGQACGVTDLCCYGAQCLAGHCEPDPGCAMDGRDCGSVMKTCCNGSACVAGVKCACDLGNTGCGTCLSQSCCGQASICTAAVACISDYVCLAQCLEGGASLASCLTQCDHGSLELQGFVECAKTTCTTECQ